MSCCAQCSETQLAVESGLRWNKEAKESGGKGLRRKPWGVVWAGGVWTAAGCAAAQWCDGGILGG